MTKHVIIIGAGIGGLATANLLAKAGYTVEVFEQHSRPGGRAGQLKKDGFTFDTGPSWYLMPEVFEHYYRLLNRAVTDELDLTRLDPAYKVFFESHAPITITSNLAHDAATFEQIEPGAGKALKTYVTKSETIYQLAIDHFLYTNFQDLRDLLKPAILRRGSTMLRLLLQPIHSYVRAHVRDLRLQQILEYPMVFLGTTPFAAPAMYSLMSAIDFREGVFYPRGGIYTIIESLTRIGATLGVTYHYGATVTRITTQNGRATGITLADGTQRAADIVISNADLHFTETALLDAQVQSYPKSYWKHKEAGPSALLINLGIKGSIPEFTHHNLLFVDAWRQNFDDIATGTIPEKASIYICKPSQTDTTVALKGHENLFVLVPLPAGVELSLTQTEERASHYLAQIETMTGVTFRERIVSQTYMSPSDFGATFNSWRNSMLGPSHILKQSAFFRNPNKSKKLANLYYVGAGTTPGIGLPMCLIGAELVYKRIIGDRRGGRVAAIRRQETQ